MIKGNEIFTIQGKITSQLGGMFGPSEKQRTLIAVALDAAVIFGMLMKDENESMEVLEREFNKKLDRILGDKI